MANNIYKYQDCSCPYCETELKKRCFSAEFCKPCCASGKEKNVKICSVCRAEYAYEYNECPACTVASKTKS